MIYLMKAKQVLKLLNISRVTLWSYVKNGIIDGTKLPNGFYDYDEDSVYAFLGKRSRVNVIYSRVSTYKQKEDLKRQTKKLKKYCKKNDIIFDQIFSDISSGIDLDRPNFSKLLDLVFDRKIDTIYITYRDRLTRLSFQIIKSIFNKFGTKIIPIYQCNDTNYIELFDDVTSLMHYFSTRKYSNRKNKN